MTKNHRREEEPSAASSAAAAAAAAANAIGDTSTSTGTLTLGSATAASAANYNYTDYISSRHSTSSSFDNIDDNSATLPRSNKKKSRAQQRQSSSFSDAGGAVLELSSLFRSDSTDSQKQQQKTQQQQRGQYQHKRLGSGGLEEESSVRSSNTPPRLRRGRRRSQEKQIKRNDNDNDNDNDKGYQSLPIQPDLSLDDSPNNESLPLTGGKNKSIGNGIGKIGNGGGVWDSFNNLNLLGQQKHRKVPEMNFGELSTSLTAIREEGSDQEEEDPLMEVMDYLEDEIDEHTYDDLIPLQIRMALEDQVFGWDHFFSNILGHVSFTVGSYLLTFWLITFVVLHELPWGINNHDGHGHGQYDNQYDNNGIVYDDGGVVGGEVHATTSTSTTISSRSNSPWGMPHELFSFVRTALSIASAISTFRTIRRRRRVWLRHAYGSAEYLASQGGQVTERMEEADRRARRFVLGSKLWAKMQRSYTKRRNRYLARGVNRKLMKAQRMFERRHRARVKLIRSTSATSLIDHIGSPQATMGSGKKSRAVASALTRHGHESSHHERVRMLAASPMSSVRKDYDSSDAGSVGSTSLTTAVGEEQGEHGYHGFVNSPMSQYAVDSHTLPNFAMESVSHDQMPFAHGEIKKIPYVHGGFFGAAPFMLTNPHWIAILRILMPDVYVEISRRASYAPAPRLIHWAENNPVVAAYGTAHEIEFSGKVPTLEWDVFLDPFLVRRVEIVLSQKEAFLQRQKDARSGKKASSRGETKTNDGVEGEGNDKAGGGIPTSSNSNNNNNNNNNAPPPIKAADERLVLSHLDKEIERRTTLLVERMLIAHGNVAQLMLEQTGYLKKYNFSRVKRTRKTLGGGIYARQWLAVYSEAMKLGMGYEEDGDEDDDGDGDAYHGDEASDSGTEDCSLETAEREDFDYADHDHDDHQREMNLDSPFVSPGSKSATQSLDAGMYDNPSSERDGSGPPRKIVMMRSNKDNDNESDDDDDDTDGSTNSDPSLDSEPSLRRKFKSPTPRSSGRSAAYRRRKRRGTKMSPTKSALQRRVEATSLNKASVCPDKTISESISLLRPILQCAAPFGLVLDMKSRHVSRRVWALVIDYLRDCGARVEGIASFIVEEVRDITQYCSSNVNEIVFIHSAGDLQSWCHDGQIQRGDRVFFNAGSLLWDYPNMYDAETVKNILWHRFQPCFDGQGIKEGYRLKPYAKIIKKSSSGAPRRGSPRHNRRHQMHSESESETCDESTLDDGDSVTSDLFARLLIADRKKKSLSELDFVYEEAPDGICSTIQQYKDYYNLSIGLYVQEFAIDEVAISLIVKYVNSNLHVYDLGLSWGGINGLTVKGIQPGRFTATDGLWNQRYGGMPWTKELKPGAVISRE